MKKERKPNEPLLDKQRIFLQLLVKEHCSEYDAVELNEFGEIELIHGTTWKWLAKFMGKIERIPFLDICWDIAQSIAKDDEKLLNQIQQYLYAYATGGSKSELVSRLLIANEIGFINVGGGEGSVQIELPQGLFMVDVSTQYVDAKTGKSVFEHPNMLEFFGAMHRRR